MFRLISSFRGVEGPRSESEYRSGGAVPLAVVWQQYTGILPYSCVLLLCFVVGASVNTDASTMLFGSDTGGDFHGPH